MRADCYRQCLLWFSYGGPTKSLDRKAGIQLALPFLILRHASLSHHRPRRDVLTERRIEAARSEMAAAAPLSCVVCMAAPRDTFLNCGHLVCR